MRIKKQDSIQDGEMIRRKEWLAERSSTQVNEAFSKL
jgi:hypothetical protein